MPAPLFRILLGSIEKQSFPLLRGVRNRQVNKKRKSPNENFTVTIIISSLELYWLPCLPGGLTWPFNSLLMEGFAKFKFSHIMSPWTLRVSCVQCRCFLSALPGSSSLMGMNHISFGALSFLGFEMRFGQIISRLYGLHFSKWRAGSQNPHWFI